MHNDFEHLMVHRERETDSIGRRRPGRRRTHSNTGEGALRMLTRELRLRWSGVLEAVGTRAIARAAEIRRKETVPV